MKNNILITGMPRAGTSVYMRICAALGYNVLGVKWPAHVNPESNPEGYYELDEGEYVPAMRTLANSTGNVVKCFASFLSMLPVSSVDKVIYCTRNVGQAIDSLHHMFDMAKELTWYGETHVFDKTREEAELVMRNNMFAADRWISFHNIKPYYSKLEYLKEDPQTVIKEVIEYFGEGDNLNDAIALVRG